VINFYFKKNKNINKCIVSAILTVSLVATPLFLVNTHETKAFDAVTVVGGLGTVQDTLSAGFNSVSAAADTVTSSSISSLAFKEYVLDPVAFFVAKAAINVITESTVNWINGGFDGNPAFVDDFGGFLREVADRSTAQFIEGTALELLCSPWRANIRVALSIPSGFRQEVACTLSDIVANIDNFVNGDFRQGGWGGWFQLTTRPNNNPYSLYISSASQLDSRIARQQSLDRDQLNWGRGFLSYKKCDEGGQPTTPGGGPGAPTNCKIVTPGAVIEDQLANVLGSSVRQLELADEFNEIIGALLNQLVLRVVGGAGGGLRGARTSFTSQLGSASGGTDLTSIKNSTIRAINKEINGEIDYRNVKQITLNAALASENLLANLQVCYANKLTDLSLNLTSAEEALAQTRMSNASSTIASQVIPIKTLLENDVDVSDQNLATLNKMSGDVESSTNATQVNVHANILSELIQNGSLNSTSLDTLYAQREQDTITAQMSSLNATTNTQITECQNFPPPPAPVIPPTT